MLRKNACFAIIRMEAVLNLSDVSVYIIANVSMLHHQIMPEAIMKKVLIWKQPSPSFLK